jgi:hypothetical protein
LEMGSHEVFAWLASNYNPTDRGLSNGLDYKCEPLALGSNMLYCFLLQLNFHTQSHAYGQGSVYIRPQNSPSDYKFFSLYPINLYSWVFCRWKTN